MRQRTRGFMPEADILSLLRLIDEQVHSASQQRYTAWEPVRGRAL